MDDGVCGCGNKVECDSAELQRRISIAAEQVCGPMSLHEAGGLQSLMRNRQCYEEASSAAMSQIDATQTAAIGQ